MNFVLRLLDPNSHRVWNYEHEIDKSTAKSVVLLVSHISGDIVRLRQVALYNCPNVVEFRNNIIIIIYEVPKKIIKFFLSAVHQLKKITE